MHMNRSLVVVGDTHTHTELEELEEEEEEVEVEEAVKCFMNGPAPG